MRIELAWIGVTALCWGAYPLVARATGYEGPRGTLILMLAGLVPIGVSAAWYGQGAWPDRMALGRLLLAGVMMGFGLLAFYALANSPIDASLSIPAVDGAMLLVSSLGAIWFLGEAATLQKTLGILCILAGMVLLRPT